jgi:Fe-Mn family superoxide dismutase
LNCFKKLKPQNFKRKMLTNVSKIVSRNAISLSKGLTSKRSKYTLPDLPYDYNALEPVISADIMKIHHTGHHQAYVTNLNVATEKLQEAQAKNDIKAIVTLGSALKFHGGGHLNHSIFWSILCPNGTSEPIGELAEAIKRDFGSYSNMVAQLSASSVGIQGSGWGWLGYNKVNNKLEIATCANQDPLAPTTGLQPLFGIDVWEHAYYLQYKSARAEYVKNIFKIANWRKVEEFYAAAKK